MGQKAQASPCPSRFATARRRNGCVILRAICSPPVALHPASLRRNFRLLQWSRPAWDWTRTNLTTQRHGRTWRHASSMTSRGGRSRVCAARPAPCASATPAACGQALKSGSFRPHRRRGRSAVGSCRETDDVAHVLHELRVRRSLNASLRRSYSENAFHMRCTVDVDTPDAWPIPRVLQWVASAGLASSVLTTMASIRSSLILLGAPQGGSSSRPSSRCSTKRSRQRRTVWRVTPTASAI